SGGVSVLSESIPLPEPMTSYALRLLEHVGWHGVAMVEFKVEEDSGRPLLMEVNGRFWGSLQLAIDSGVNFPVLLYNLATRSEAGLPSTEYRTGIRLRWLLGDLDHLLLYLFKDRADLHLPRGATSSKLTKFLEFLKFYQRGMHYEVLRLADPLPFAYELKHFICSLFQRAS
ncbi:MAG: ATP-grasp domain-containing protein, partial [Nitrososphaera sp.]